MARLRKWPRAPKANASMQTWDNYKRRVAEVKKQRADIAAAPRKKAAIREQVRKMKN